MSSKLALMILVTIIISSISAMSFFVPSAKGTIWIEGHITSNTTWTPMDTYRVIGDTCVDSGIELIIQPNVRVEFADGVSLIVEGSLHSIGTENGIIRFTSSRSNPSRGVWGGIKFKGGVGEDLILRYTRLEYAETGIEHLEGGQVSISTSEIYNNSIGIGVKSGNINIERSHFESNVVAIRSIHEGSYPNITIDSNFIVRNQRGIYFDSILNAIDLSIRYNDISWNEYEGIYIDKCDPMAHFLIQGNRLYSNCKSGTHSVGQAAIVLHGLGWTSPVTSGFVSIRDNFITSNGWIGIYITAWGAFSAAEIVNNTISENHAGMSLSYRPSDDSVPFAVTNNWIQSNTAEGIEFREIVISGLLFEVLVSNNSIADNSKGILFSGSYGRMRIVYNSILDNEVGVEIDHFADHSIEHNDIKSNTQGILAPIEKSIDAENNYWGHSLGPYHESLNPEGGGNPVSGNVDFIPFLQNEVSPVIPEFPSLLILPLFMAVALVTVTVHRRRILE